MDDRQDPLVTIRMLLDSEVCNYLESSERLQLGTCLQKSQSGQTLDDKELESIRAIFRKYRRYLG